MNSPLPRLIGHILSPLAGEWTYDKHERLLTALTFGLKDSAERKNLAISNGG